MKNKKFYCKDCKRFFDNPIFLVEKHGLDCPPYERMAVCINCGSSNFVIHKNFIEKIDVAERILPVVMYLNRYCNALEDIYGSSIRNEELNASIENIVEAISEMFEFLDNDVDREIFKMSSESELQRILMRLKG